jgi:hypothetical protein
MIELIDALTVDGETAFRLTRVYGARFSVECCTRRCH